MAASRSIGNKHAPASSPRFRTAAIVIPIASRIVHFITVVLPLSHLQHAAAIASFHEKTRTNNNLRDLIMGGTVVAEYQACSKCFAGSVFDKKKKKGTQQI